MADDEFQMVPVPKRQEQPFTMAPVPKIGAPEPDRPPPFAGTNWKDVGTGLAGAPAVATSILAGTPRDIHDMRRNIAPQRISDEQAGLNYIAQHPELSKGQNAVVDPKMQGQLSTLSKISQPVLPRLWHEYVDPILFGQENEDASGRVTTQGGIMPSQQGTYAKIPESLKTYPTTAEGKKAQEIGGSSLSAAATLPLGIGEGTAATWLKGLGPWALKNLIRTGIISGGEYGGEQAADWLASDPSRETGAAMAPYAQPAISLASQILAHKVAPHIGTSEKVSSEAAGLIRKDREEMISKLQEHDLDYIGTASGLTHEQVKEALRAGVPLHALNIGGANVRDYLAHASELSEDARAALAKYNEKLKPSAAGDLPLYRMNAQDRLTDFFKGKIGEMNMDDAVAARTRANKAEVKRIYDETMDVPEAQSVVIPKELANNTAIKKAMQDVNENIGVLKNEYGYEGRDVIPPKAEGEPFHRYDERTGQVVAERDPASNGNLAYWDMVKKRLWDNSQLEAPKSLERSGINDARKQLTKHLDDTVGGYANARNEHIEGVGELNAANIGREFSMNAGSKALDKVDTETGMSRRGLLRSEIQRMDPEQLQIAQQGAYDSLRARMKTPADVQKLARDLLQKPEYGEDLKLVLGEDEYYLMRGKVIGESIVANAPEINVAGKAKGPAAAAISDTGFVGKAGVVGAVVNTLVDMFMTQPFLPEHLQGLGLVTGTLAAGAAGKKYLTALEAKRMAEQVVPLLLSKDPKTVMRLSKLADKDFSVNRMVTRLALPAQSFGSQQPVSTEEQHAAGGRIGRASGGGVKMAPKYHAAQLISLVDKIKKGEDKQTSTLLNLDDTTVAKALAIANKHI